jgi:uncharacterized protein YydD (DUF2326 family)
MREQKRVFNKLFKEEKTELSTEKVELSLSDAQKIINKSKSHGGYRDKIEGKLNSLKKEMRSYVDEVEVVVKEISRDMSSLVKAGVEIDKIKKDMSGSGIPTSPLDARKEEIKSTYNFLAKVSNDLSRVAITAKNL